MGEYEKTIATDILKIFCMQFMTSNNYGQNSSSKRKYAKSD
jgi:hypothetical protein